jgi:hypothetical protein
MTGTGDEQQMSGLDVFVGEWVMAASFASDPGGAPRARTVFEWLKGRRFLLQRWEIDHPDAPDGVAIIGPSTAPEHYIQHYFDSRGVERVYEMSFDGRIWVLERRATKPDFSQRFTGTVTRRGTIAGRWEMSDDGVNWRHDFDLTYTRLQ